MQISHIPYRTMHNFLQLACATFGQNVFIVLRSLL